MIPQINMPGRLSITRTRAPSSRRPFAYAFFERLSGWLRRRQIDTVMRRHGTQAVDTGADCLRIVAHRLGRRHARLARRSQMSARATPIVREPLSLAQLVQFAATLELCCRPVRLSYAQLLECRLPLILLWRADAAGAESTERYVVLHRIDAARVCLLDPVHGEFTAITRTAQQHYDGIALLVEPAGQLPAARPATEQGGAATSPPGFANALQKVALLSVALMALGLAAASLLANVIEQALPQRAENLAALTLVLMLLGLACVALSWQRRLVLEQMAAMLRQARTAKIINKLVHRAIHAFEARSRTELAGSLAELDPADTHALACALRRSLDGGLSLLLLFPMVYLDLHLGLIAVFGLLMSALLSLRCFAARHDALERALQTRSQQQRYLHETLLSMQAIKLFGREHSRAQVFMQMVAGSIAIELAERGKQARLQAEKRGLLCVEFGLTIFLGSRLVQDGTLGLGLLASFMLYKTWLCVQAGGLIDLIVAWRLRPVQNRMLARKLGGPSEVELAQTPAPLVSAARSGAIRLQRVAFHYPGQAALVLDQFSLELAAGETVTIVGRSGSGKTVLQKLLLGELAPVAGEVRIDGRTLAQCGLGAWRTKLAAVLQEDVLFTGSLADNIAFFDGLPNQSHIEQCARIAQVHEEIMQLPDAYATTVRSGMNLLPRALVQRVLLARALYKRPAILLLDEATSQLAPALEEKVFAALDTLPMTRIVFCRRAPAGAGRVLALDFGAAD
jgi:ATP-binding cassette subfamily B protein RaxB